MRQCPICGDSFESRGGLKSHLHSVHSVTYAQIKGMVLDESKPEAARMREAEGRQWQHKYDRQERDPGPFECHRCGEVYDTREGLSRHYRYHEEQGRADRKREEARKAASELEDAEFSRRLWEATHRQIAADRAARGARARVLEAQSAEPQSSKAGLLTLAAGGLVLACVLKSMGEPSKK